MFDYLIVGAGFAGSVMAERLAEDAGKKVLIIDKRNHIGGNAYDHYDDAGVLVHKYGPHIFHTNSRDVFEYLSRFTEWRQYQHRVQAWVDGQLLPIPINLETINRMYGLQAHVVRAAGFLRERSPKSAPSIKTSEDVIVSKVGRELYEKFFRNYTRKQWDLDPSELDAAVTARVPVRTNNDDRYFTDTYQAMPKHGYTRMFEKMLSHPNIKVMLNADYREVQKVIPHDEVIYTGPVDEYFDYRYGRLPYRSLEFKFETLNKERHQPVAVINYPERQPVHAGHGVQVSDRPGASQDVARLRISEGVGRSVLSDSAQRERGALPQVSDARGGDQRRALRRKTGDLQVLQHGSGRRAGADALLEDDQSVAAAKHSRMARDLAPARPHVFDSFWMGGFEAATHINGAGRRLDMLAATAARRPGRSMIMRGLKASASRTVRDAVRWHLIERDGTFDFSSLAPMVVAAERHGMQVMWTLLHYGVPDDVDVFSAEFPERFARFSARSREVHSEPFAAAALLHARSTRFRFLAWAAGEVGWFCAVCETDAGPNSSGSSSRRRSRAVKPSGRSIGARASSTSIRSFTSSRR